MQAKDVKINFFHGALQGEGLNRVDLRSVSRGLIKLVKCSGDVNLGLIQDYCNGVVETRGKVIVNTSKCGEQKVWHNGELVSEAGSGKASLFLHSEELVLI